ncbi:hypothetical protein QBC46DRAFT_154442 [Diplogelasinospora grovesii]|uniref:Uncharacterized protein n=1 Tax=Diplogelasinospora grovesii TaxID=303347 RepID=A0AAN6S434_9PEZI|nr:hypothetical protein QBC46DRAFT_154442 [Diplogelasinospora grovesii]
MRRRKDRKHRRDSSSLSRVPTRQAIKDADVHFEKGISDTSIHRTASRSYSLRQRKDPQSRPEVPRKQQRWRGEKNTYNTRKERRYIQESDALCTSSKGRSTAAKSLAIEDGAAIEVKGEDEDERIDAGEISASEVSSNRVVAQSKSPSSCGARLRRPQQDDDDPSDAREESIGMEDGEYAASLARHRKLVEEEQLSRKRATDYCQKTGDISVFKPFLAPFVKTADNKPQDLGPWTWSRNYQRWFRENNNTGSILWAPLPDSFC